MINRNKTEAFRFLQQRVVAKLNSWYSNLLSLSGKEILIKAVVMALPTYCFTCFLLPDKILNQITKEIRKFWWSADKDKHKIHWVAWDKITSPKSEGGLGFRDLKLFNIALVAKQTWRILQQPQSLLARVIKAKYFPSSSLFDVALGTNPSQIWRSIHHATQYVKKGYRWLIGNGKKIRIWNDNWLPQHPSLPSTCRPTDVSASHYSNDVRVEVLFHPNTTKWDTNKLNQLVHPEDVTRVKQLIPSITNAEDTLIWSHTQSGEYTVRSGYHYLRRTSLSNNTNHGQSEQLSKLLWKVKAPPKIKMFLWRATYNGLPVFEQLNKRGLHIDPTCALCGEEVESVNHLLFSCRVAREIWELSPISHRQGTNLSCNNLSSNLLYYLSKNDRQTSLFAFLCWRIWKSRNELIFKNVRRFIPDIINKAYLDYNLWEEVVDMQKQDDNFVNQRSLAIQPQEPRAYSSTHFVYVDGSWTSKSHNAGVGWILCNSQNQKILNGKQSFHPVNTPLEVEAIALREVVCQVRRLGYNDVIFQGDSHVIYDYLANGNSDPTKLCPYSILKIMEDIKVLSRPDYRFMWIPRAVNKCADFLAKDARLKPAGFCNISWYM